ncbi:MAG: PocR ligand-binding domain-containing protein [Verrucomicrobia bacterium]|nr:PocR ligand-binding domain-containing protein [Verrucomicrobiota bacterium]MCF7707974.1 PocR ligand-binding domain-containing protein [Verrucomicrobiota bacterium]
MVCNDNKSLIERLSKSQIFQDYERAFSEATGLPLALRPVEVWQLVLHGKKNQSPFCSLMINGSRTCAACLDVQKKLSSPDVIVPQTVTCFAGLIDAAVPVRIGNELIGFLQTGQVRTKAPTRSELNRITKLLISWGLSVDLKRVEEAFFHTRVISPKQFESVIRLLSIFAQHLSIVSHQLMIRQANAEPLNIIKAKKYIHDHQTDDISLSEVAKAVNTSTYYFCKIFKKSTGLNFTEYLSCVRIEKAKNLLLNPNLRVSEIAYEVGFQSLTHFNRVFRKLVGESPTAFRNNLMST